MGIKITTTNKYRKDLSTAYYLGSSEGFFSALILAGTGWLVYKAIKMVDDELNQAAKTAK